MVAWDAMMVPMSSASRIGVIICSTRPARVGPTVADWTMQQTSGREGADYELIDLAEIGLPLLDEPEPAASGNYTKEHTKRWASTIEALDGFVFVAPEYNRGIPGALKNALDFLYVEWNNKAAGLVVYGSSGGLRAAEQLKLVLAELQVTTVRNQVSLSIYDDMTNFTEMSPRDYQSRNASAMLDQLERHTAALQRMQQAIK